MTQLRQMRGRQNLYMNTGLLNERSQQFLSRNSDTEKRFTLLQLRTRCRPQPHKTTQSTHKKPNRTRFSPSQNRADCLACRCKTNKNPTHTHAPIPHQPVKKPFNRLTERNKNWFKPSQDTCILSRTPNQTRKNSPQR